MRCPASSGFRYPSPDCYAGRNWCPGYDRDCQVVSILARLLRRAQQPNTHTKPHKPTQFQSSPDCYAGRNTEVATTVNDVAVSILARLLRRAQQGTVFAVPCGLRVSILARLLRRAQRIPPTARPGAEARFNPRPTVTPGATSGLARIVSRAVCVSILARLLRRATS